MTISIPFDILCVAWSKDGDHIAVGLNGGNILIWNTSTGMTVSGPFYAGGEYVSSVAFLHDGLCLASGSSDGTIRFWEVMTGKEAAVKGKSRLLEGHTGSVSALSFFGDGKQLVSGSEDRTILIWDMETREMVAGT